jgi:uncharacterized membrane protein YphA (DoxX/SURF4 family)
MNTGFEFQQGLAMMTIRIVAGVLFFFQAYDKIFRLGLADVTRSFSEKFKVAYSLLYIAVTVSSIIELSGGFLLIIGLLPDCASILLAIDLIFVVAAFSIVRPMWDMQYVFPRLVLIVSYLLLSRYDIYTLHNLIRS